MTDILVNIGGIVLMAAIVGWFWLSGNTARKSQTSHHH